MPAVDAPHGSPSGFTLKAANAAARRMLLQSLVRRAGVALSIGVGAACAGVLADRLIGPGLDQRTWWFILGGVAAGAGAWTAITAWRKRPRAIDGAIVADSRLGLRDALSSGLELSHRAASGDDAFARVAVEDAEAIAKDAPISRATPIRFDNWWALWPALATASVALTFVQPLDLLTDKRARIEAAERVAEASSADKAIEEASKALEEIASSGNSPTEDNAPPSPAEAQRLEALNKLREQLSSGAKSSDDARAEAASELSRAADAAAQEAQQQAQSQESVAKAMSGLKPEELGAADSPAKRLAEALQSADADAAARTAEGMSKSLSEMTPSQRREEARRLSTLAKQLEQLAAQKQRDAESPREAEQELTRQGVSEQEAKSLSENADPKSVEDELKRRGFDEDTARRLAEKMATEKTERESRKRAAEELNETAKAVDRAKDEAQSPPNTTPPGSNPDSPDGGTKQPGEPSPPRASPPPSADENKNQAQGDPKGEPRPGQPSSKPNGPQEGAPTDPKQPSTAPDNTKLPRTPADTTAPKGIETGREQKQGEKGQPVSKPGEAPLNGTPPQGAPPQPTPSPNPDGKTPPTPQPSSGESQQPSPQQPGDQSPQGQGGKPPDAPNDGKAPSAPPQPQPGGEKGESPKGQSPSSPDGKQPPSPGGQPSPQPQPGQSPGQQPGQQPGKDGDPSGSSTAPSAVNPQPNDGKQATKPSNHSGDSDRPGPSDANGHAPSGSHGAGKGERPNPSNKNGVQSLKDRLERLAKSPAEARRKMEDARKLRDQAEKMLESMTPEQRKELERLARDRARESGAPLEGVKSAPVDFRPEGTENDPTKPPPGDREVLAEFNDPNAKIDRTAPAGTRAMQPTAQETLKSVQKAIEEKQLPARYRNVEKYFKRAAEQESPKPASDAKSVAPVKDAEAVNEPTKAK
jgi:hypothetical protein